MPMIRRSTLAAVLAASTAMPLAAEEGPMTLDAVRWVLGTWVQESETSTTTETWTATSDHVFAGQGIARRTGEKDPRFVESLLLVEMSGAVFYVAKVPENEYPIPFRMVEASESHAVFTNPNHDFPRRIEYRLQEDGELHVTPQRR